MSRTRTQTASTTATAEGEEFTAVNRQFHADLHAWISCGKQLIHIRTEDDAQAFSNIRMVADEMGRMATLSWDSVQGWKGGTVDLDEDVARIVAEDNLGDLDPRLLQPNHVLGSITRFQAFTHGVCVLWNFHEYLNNRAIREVLHNLVKSNQLACQDYLRPIVLLSYGNNVELHPEIRGRATTIDFGLPDREEILEGSVRYIVVSCQADRPNAPPPEPELLADIAKACSGMSRSEINDAIAFASVSRGITPDILGDVRRHKAKMLGRSRVLVPHSDAALVAVDQIGGMEGLLEDMRCAASSYTDRSRRSGIPLPGGIMIMGVPGCGKSHVAKGTGRIFRDVVHQEFPVVKIDIGAIFAKHVGDSESNWRDAKRVLAIAGPCVAYIDEAERALSGMASSGSTDSGVGQRVFGDFLTWCQDRFAEGDSTYLIFTMNNPKILSQHAPALFRRTDQKYFVDTPDHGERKAILKIHVRDQLASIEDRPLTLGDLDWKEEDWDALAEATQNFVGDELAKAVVKSRRIAFAEGDPYGIPRFDDLIGAKVVGDMKDHVFAVMQRAELEELREFCRDAKPVRPQVTRPAPAPRPQPPIVATRRRRILSDDDQSVTGSN